MYCLLTNDVESISLVTNELNLKTAEKVFNEGLPRLIDLYDQYKIKATFFITGEILEKIPEIVKLVDTKKHEIACHGYSHHVNEAFDILSYNEQKAHLIKAKMLLENLSGKEIVSFRAPALRVNKDTPKALLETGFLNDSSISSQRFDFFLSFGSIKKLNRFFAPRMPYFTDENNLAKKGNSKILEIPISAMLYPYISTTMRIFPKITGLFRNLLIFESKMIGKPINFLTHPNEFIDEDKTNIKFNRRTKNLFSYLLADRLRFYLKLKNLGFNGLKIYENEIKVLKSHNFNFITINEYRELITKNEENNVRKDS